MSQYFAHSEQSWYPNGSESSSEQHMYASQDFRRRQHSHSPPHGQYRQSSPAKAEAVSGEVYYSNGTAYFPQATSPGVTSPTPARASSQYQSYNQRRIAEKQAVTFSGQHIMILPSARNCEASPAFLQMLA